MNSPIIPTFFSLLLLLISTPVYAQTSIFETPPVPLDAIQYEKEHRDAVADSTTEDGADDNEFGSLSGRVLFDAAAEGETGEAKPLTMPGVKVVVRRVDGGFGNFLFDRVSSPDGKYEFQYLRPGRYTIEIDRATLPNAVPQPDRKVVFVDITLAKRTHFDLYVAPQREVMGTVFIDVDGDGRFRPGKDQPLSGVSVIAGGSLAVSDSNGSYVLRDLPAGRIGLLVNSSRTNESSHVILDLGTGPVTKRVVNVPMNR